jgi:nucleoside-diphosphate-sugar epimerase
VKVILFGATGMVGAGVLHECLRDDRVHEVWAVQRSSSGTSHPKLRELIRTDFMDFGDALEDFHGADACFFCLGVTAVGKSEEEYSRLTFDLTLAAGRAMAEVTPGMTSAMSPARAPTAVKRGG